MRQTSIIFLCGLLVCACASESTDPRPVGFVGDVEMRRSLESFGLDLEQEHPIMFYLSLPTQSNAESAAANLKAAGYELKIYAKKDVWMCRATKRMRPSLPALREIGPRMRQLAGQFEGQYEGWGSQLPD